MQKTHANCDCASHAHGVYGDLEHVSSARDHLSGERHNARRVRTYNWESAAEKRRLD